MQVNRNSKIKNNTIKNNVAIKRLLLTNPSSDTTSKGAITFSKRVVNKRNPVKINDIKSATKNTIKSKIVITKKLQIRGFI
ncbi:MAG: hypothetical protein Fur006_61050 [Coleofasciculaceae cyanobacterium]